jgi:hypothetical protein
MAASARRRLCGYVCVAIVPGGGVTVMLPPQPHKLLLALIVTVVVRSAPVEIDRECVVSRHFPKVTASANGSWSKEDFLAIGNGQFGLAVDVTGLQTFGGDAALCLLSDMHWFTAPWDAPGDPFTAAMEEGVFIELETRTAQGTNRTVKYPMNNTGKAAQWLAANPSRMDLGQLSFVQLTSAAAAGRPPSLLLPSEITQLSQRLDTWRGMVTSNWTHAPSGIDVEAKTMVDMASSSISLEVTVTEPGLGVQIAFAYPGSGFAGCRDFTRPSQHSTVVTARSPDGSSITLHRTIELEEHTVQCRGNNGSWGALAFSAPPHHFVFTPSTAAAGFTLSCTWSDPGQPLQSRRSPPVGGWSSSAIAVRTAAEWRRFWTSGAFLDLQGGGGGSSSRATAHAQELERRVVLSQYLMRAMEWGPLPPQETGLFHNSWHGKHHQEMRYWHQAHHAMWGRTEPLERSDQWYIDSLPNASWYAQYQGYDGARWPKACGVPNPRYSNTLPPSQRSNGTAVYWDWPGPISTILIWDQPHAIWVSELQYQACAVKDGRTRLACEAETLQRLRHVVHLTATFMASYLSYDAADGKFHVGPPVAGAAESGQQGSSAQSISDPTFELTQFAVTLTVANRWRARLGQPPNATWAHQVSQLAPAPQVSAPSSAAPSPLLSGAALGAFGSEICPNGTRAVTFSMGVLRTAEGDLCLDTAHLGTTEYQLLPTRCDAESETQQWIHPTNHSHPQTNLHLKSVHDGRCLAVWNGGKGIGGIDGVGIWNCGTDDPSGQGWNVDATTSIVSSRDKGSAVLCMASLHLPSTPPAGPSPPPWMIYNQNAACTGAYTSKAQLCEGDSSHPAVLLALGMLPGEAYGIDAMTMNRTLDEVLNVWNWDSAWGWDFGLMAMTAARLGRSDAVDILMKNATKNRYLTCGCNAPLNCYMPGNGALLGAVSMMANLHAFPPSWSVVAEGFPPTL